MENGRHRKSFFDDVHFHAYAHRVSYVRHPRREMLAPFYWGGSAPVNDEPRPVLAQAFHGNDVVTSKF